MTLLAACAAPPAPPQVPSGTEPASASSAPSSAEQAGLNEGPALEPIARPRSMWVPARWAELPGWEQDSPQQWLPALQRSCERPAPAWVALCAEVRSTFSPAEVRSTFSPAEVRSTIGPAEVRSTLSPADVRSIVTPADLRSGPTTAEAPGSLAPAEVRGTVSPAETRSGAPITDAQWRSWLQARLQPLRVTTLDGASEGLLTGYFEPLLEARRRPAPGFQVPLHSPPADLSTRRPWWSRQQIETHPAARAALQGREVAYLRHPLDLLILQIQGSGRLDITEPDGRRRLVRMAFAGHNDLPYQSVGKWLIEQGELRAFEASWPGIKAWALANPRRLQEMMWVNPRYVFFREEALPQPEVGPKGAQGVPLLPGRSIAVDPLSIPYGTPVWLASTDPLGGPALQRGVVAQDTGSAIVGAVRADYFAGWGELAEAQAGRMKQPLRLWVLWPRSARTP